MSKQCVICGTVENLNTSFELILFGNSYKVHLCTEHEDTTMKAAREALQNRLTKIDVFIEEAKSYGLNFVLKPDDVKTIADSYGLVCITKEEYENLKSKKAAATNKKMIAPSQEFIKQMSKQQPSNNSETENTQTTPVEHGVVDYSPQAESKRPEPSGLVGQDMLQYAPIKTKREKDLKIESKSITTKGGRVIDGITTLMKSSEGVTRINIVQGIDDTELQKRMKVYDQASKDGMEVNQTNMFRNCRKCGGLGSFKNGTTICAVCKGSGIISNF